ncbi:CLUMA_CG017752, isoform A [Clunio marinus]|uniref:CLUMA_CG017752, isoform A n=1 Tax=Clunio marinus TaxID=568069 RepID=A0A1J1IX57_9DIPT|nr:CLUMA_CG017752, isoform A [Clunio marinus]
MYEQEAEEFNWTHQQQQEQQQKQQKNNKKSQSRNENLENSFEFVRFTFFCLDYYVILTEMFYAAIFIAIY